MNGAQDQMPGVSRNNLQLFSYQLSQAVAEELKLIADYSLRTNKILSEYLSESNIELVDFKLEFGKFHGQLLLGDEFSPDGCRLWDKKTMKKLDKDRFRQNLGGVMEAYEEVAHRIGVPL